MDETLARNPAEQAAAIALDQVCTCIAEGRSFLLEAGAGAGKTETLIRALKYLVSKRGEALLRQNQKIVCITFTNVASHEIETRTDRHEAIHSSTIHAFCWSAIKDFQPNLRDSLGQIGKWPERFKEAGGVTTQKVEYDLGYPKVDNNHISLGHDDVLLLTVALLAQPKFRAIFTARYPILFIDEYQDTKREFAQALIDNFVDTGSGPLLGFFGDDWQKIYGDGCGKINHPRLTVIGQKSNFRSVKAIVDTLNKIRPELPQDVVDPDAPGNASAYHTNLWRGERRTEAHWKGDLPPSVAHDYLEKLQRQLALEGWSFDTDETKILMLTHNVLALEQGYFNLAQVFPNSEAYIKKEDALIAFFDDILEPVCTAYASKRFGEMFDISGEHAPTLHSSRDKIDWARDMDTLLKVRETETIGAVIDHLRRTRRPRLPDSIESVLQALDQRVAAVNEHEQRVMERLRELRGVRYGEVTVLTRFIDGNTLFSTKHGVKGTEFENVIVVIGRGWNLYDFNQMLELAKSGRTPGKQEEAYQRNRNLFYVACSRPKKRLALLFTQKLTDLAMRTLADWFGDGNVHSLVDA